MWKWRWRGDVEVWVNGSNGNGRKRNVNSILRLLRLESSHIHSHPHNVQAPELTVAWTQDDHPETRGLLPCLDFPIADESVNIILLD